VGFRKKTLAAAVAAASLLAVGVVGAVAAAPTPPQIRESLTPLPCPPKPKTTLQLKACAEQRILKSDAEINKRVRNLWGILKTAGPRARFAAAERAWFAYRVASCKSRSDVFKGGTLTKLEYANCVADVNRLHVRELTRFQADLLKNR
jgi:uncharacterized protein YecT (DUF1311 family)